MMFLLGIVVFVLVGQAVLLAVAIGEAHLLHGLLPAADFGICMLACLLSTMFMALLVRHVLATAMRFNRLMQPEFEPEDDSDDDESDQSAGEDDSGEIVVEPLGDLGSYRLSTPETRERKRRKR